MLVVKSNFLKYFCRKFSFVYSRKEKKELLERFWIDFDNYCSEIEHLKFRRRKWILHKTKVPKVHLLFDLNRSGVEVAIELSHRNELNRLDVFEKLRKYKVILEEDFEDGLNWEPNYLRANGITISRIFVQKEGLDFHQQESWQATFEFMASNMYLLEHNFLQIRELIQE